ncbi:hypothetical protein LCGC14_0096050 [marine sediment metagenome]|uniref:Uncharacterized protein n=1 Tax=marine sediment metagenome TaxID=412755 RepID=A0A0F9XWB8_9ZZZZ
MLRKLGCVVLAFGLWPGLAGGDEGEAAEAAESVIRVIVLDFNGPDGLDRKLADSLRLKLRRHDAFDVVDRITTQQLTNALYDSVAPWDEPQRLFEATGASVLLWARATRTGSTVTVVVKSTTAPNSTESTTYTDDTERWRAVICRQIVEDLAGRAQWTPPQVGDEAEPEAFGRPLNVNGSFDDGQTGWDVADNVAVFYEAGPDDRGKVLRVRTDLKRLPYLDYRRALAQGDADRANPPTIEADTSYESLGGLEGVHVRSTWIKAASGRRYWLTADVKSIAGKGAIPRIFVKGFLDAPADGLHELSLRERDLTPETFAALPEDDRTKLIKADTAAHPERYRRECYRWYLACRSQTDDWEHFAAPFPPRGGLPDNVQWLRIDIFCYWPPGQTLLDNVHLYADPRQTDPLPEQPPRTPGVRRHPTTQAR